MARAIRAKGLSGLVIDTGLRPTRGLDELARDMGVPYLPLPRADARSVSSAVDAALECGMTPALPPEDWRSARPAAPSPRRRTGGILQVTGTGPEILLLHGAGASSHTWHRLIPYLDDRYRLIAPDLPGHGFTQKPARAVGSAAGGTRYRGADADDGGRAAHRHRSFRRRRHRAGDRAAGAVWRSTALVVINGALEDFRGPAGVVFPIIGAG